MATQRGVKQYLQALQEAGLTDLPPAAAMPDVVPPEPPSPEHPSPNPVATPASEETTRPQVASTIKEEIAMPKSSQGNSGSGASGSESELEILRQEVAACTLCSELASTRTQTVFGVGNPQARLVFFGEAPGADEDRLGEPFVGRAGKLLDKIIAACTLDRSGVYILNTLKCRPPGNRNPADDEKANCRGYWERQLELIAPEFICCLGSVAAQTLLDTNQTIGRLRGAFHPWGNSQVIATYHPAYLLRNPSAKKPVWEDMQMLMEAMGIELPAAE